MACIRPYLLLSVLYFLEPAKAEGNCVVGSSGTGETDCEDVDETALIQSRVTSYKQEAKVANQFKLTAPTLTAEKGTCSDFCQGVAELDGWSTTCEENVVICSGCDACLYPFKQKEQDALAKVAAQQAQADLFADKQAVAQGLADKASAKKNSSTGRYR
jgi:hypothetical protein